MIIIVLLRKFKCRAESRFSIFGLLLMLIEIVCKQNSKRLNAESRLDSQAIK